MSIRVYNTLIISRERLNYKLRILIFNEQEKNVKYVFSSTMNFNAFLKKI